MVGERFGDHAQLRGGSVLTAAGQADARVTSGGRGFVEHAATIEPLLHPAFVKPKEKSRSPVDVPASETGTPVRHALTEWESRNCASSARLNSRSFACAVVALVPM